MPATSGAVTPSESLSPTVSPTGAVTPTVGQTVSVPEGPAPVLPAMPAQAQEMTNEGAEAFVQYWFDLANYGVATGDTGPVMTMAEPSCTVCERIRAQIAANYSDGGRILNYQWTVSDASVTMRNDNVFGLEYHLAQQDGVAIDAGGVVRQPLPASDKEIGAVVAFEDGAFALVEITKP